MAVSGSIQPSTEEKSHRMKIQPKHFRYELASSGVATITLTRPDTLNSEVDPLRPLCGMHSQPQRIRDEVRRLTERAGDEAVRPVDTRASTLGIVVSSSGWRHSKVTQISWMVARRAGKGDTEVPPPIWIVRC